MNAHDGNSAGLLDPAPAAHAVVSDPFVQTYQRAPMRFISAEGVELCDSNGRRYLDFASGIAVNALGYGDPGVRAAMIRSLDSGLIHVSNYFRTNSGDELARALVDRSFADAVFFCNSGAEANEGAFKFVRRWARGAGGERKHEIVAFRGSFHGRLFGSLAATDRAAYREPFTPLAGGFRIIERSDADLHALDAQTTAALIVEPVQGESGVRVIDAGLLRELRAFTTECGIALIFDEVQCGLGRTGTLFAYEQTGTTPDVLTLAKPLGGGLPIGAILVSGRIAAVIRPGDHGSTFGGGPLIAAVALHVLERVSDPDLLRSVRENGAWLGKQLHELARAKASVRAVRGVGYMWGIDVAERASDVVRRGWDAGILTITAGEHTLRLLPPLVMTREDLDRGTSILEEVLN